MPASLAAFLGALVGGAITIGTQSSSRRHATRLEIRKFRSEKLEKLMTLTSSCRDWLRAVGENVSLDPPQLTPGDPTAEIRIIGQLYFPELVREAAGFADCYREMADRHIRYALIKQFPQGPDSTANEHERKQELREYGSEMLRLHDEVNKLEKALTSAAVDMAKKLLSEKSKQWALD